MKKIFTLFIFVNFFCAMNVWAVGELFSDELVDNLNKNSEIKKIHPAKIVDEFVDSTSDSSLKIKPVKSSEIRDELVFDLKTDGKIKTAGNLEFDFEKLDDKKIKIHPKKRYSTKNSLIEGDFIDFVLAEDVEINNKIYKKGSFVKARVETVTKNSAYGVPADFVVSNFVLMNDVRLDGSVMKTGANRSLWVYPCTYAFLWFFGVGLLFLPIRGGHAKLSPNQIYELTFTE